MERPLVVEPNPVIERLSPYMIERPAVDPDLVLDFNESLASPAGLLEKGLRVHRYPEYGDVEAAIAASLGVAPRSVLVTNGADDALERTVRCAAGPGRMAVLTTPGYGMIRRFADLAGFEVEEVPWWDGDIPVDEMCRRAGDGGGLVSVVSPSNPTGAVASRSAVAEILERLPRSLVLLDQAYVDYTEPANDLAPVAREFPNAVLVRTFSKAWGCAGLRVGCAIGDPRVIDWLRRAGLPFPVATPSLAAVTTALETGPDRARIARVHEQRVRLTELLDDLGAETLPSEASFVFARFEDADLVWRGLGALGISVRRFSVRADVDGWLRITLPGDEPSFERLEHGVRTVLSPEAVLFDMDGVLADVSRSYRLAIIETAATWGVELKNDDVMRAKAGGNANNDWELTRSLLAERGVDADLDEVTERFEALYQGTEDAPGLRRLETLRCGRQVLERLASRYRLAVVTGRPRRDATRFLEEHEVADLFRSVVCMEDAAPKPDPEPVRLALERIGAATAWMVGDTPDDVRAARAAAALPLAVPAVGDDAAPIRSALQSAGAAIVIDEPGDIEELLP